MVDQSLPSWTVGPARAAILDFVDGVVSGPGAVAIEDRIAVFDNDGTLWTEKPMPTQLHYMVRAWSAAAKADPGLAETQPYAAAASGDLSWLGDAIDRHYSGDDTDLKAMISAIVGLTANVSVEEYEAQVAKFYAEAEHPTLKTPYNQAVYRPMVELLRYLESHDFTCYIVSGGDRDFMRPMTAAYYGIPAERVIGSALGLVYDAEANDVRYGASFDFMDDGPLKPARIWTRTGKRPLLACGNSNGDVPMLRYVQGHPRSLSLLIHHDDDTGRGDTPYDTGAEGALAAGQEHGFRVVSVRDDWSEVFASGPT